MGEGKKEKEVCVNVYKIYYSSFFEYFLYAFYIVFLFTLERVDLRDLITKPKDSIVQKQDVKELTLFDEF